MKCRNGFVSNSSSSSFLVAFPRNPKNAEEVQEIVFSKEVSFRCPFSKAVWKAESIAQYIWDGMKNQIPNNRKIIISKMYNVLVDNYQDFETPAKNPQHPGDYNFDREGYTYANKQKVIEFMDDNDGCFFYYFEYDDNEGTLEQAMRHGDLFKNLPHLVSY